MPNTQLPYVPSANAKLLSISLDKLVVSLTAPSTYPSATMVLRRGKPLKGFAGDDSSSDSDDNFLAISAKKKKGGQKRQRSSNGGAAEDTTSATNENIADIGDNNAAGSAPILPLKASMSSFVDQKQWT